MKTKIGVFLIKIVLPALAGIGTVFFLLHQAVPMLTTYALLDAVVSVGVFVLLSWSLGNVLKFYRPHNGKEWLLGLWILILTMFWVLMTYLPLRYWIPNELYQKLLIQSFWLRCFISVLVFTCISLILWLRKQNREENRAILRLHEAQDLSKRAELHSLRQQLQPHFLFNSLNSIFALIQSDPAKARTMLQNLSDFLRGTLRRDTSEMVTVDDEILQTKLYLEIEKVRFSRLNVEWEVQEACLTLLMPQMILQPLVENAIKYGFYDTTGSVTILIKLFADNGALNLTISNPFDSESTVTHKGTGFGLDSVGRRLTLLFQRTDLVRAYSENATFFVTVNIPQKQ